MRGAGVVTGASRPGAVMVRHLFLSAGGLGFVARAAPPAREAGHAFDLRISGDRSFERTRAVSDSRKPK